MTPLEILHSLSVINTLHDSYPYIRHSKVTVKCSVPLFCCLCPQQRRRLVGGALHQFGKERLHPQQLCGPR